jgi:hypothetical protein
MNKHASEFCTKKKPGWLAGSNRVFGCRFVLSVRKAADRRSVARRLRACILDGALAIQKQQGVGILCHIDRQSERTRLQGVGYLRVRGKHGGRWVKLCEVIPQA